MVAGWDSCTRTRIYTDTGPPVLLSYRSCAGSVAVVTAIVVMRAVSSSGHIEGTVVRMTVSLTDANADVADPDFDLHAPTRRTSDEPQCRFPSPWTAEESGESFHVKDANGQIPWGLCFCGTIAACDFSKKSPKQNNASWDS